MNYTLIDGDEKVTLTFTKPTYNRNSTLGYDLICQKTKSNIKLSNEARLKLQMKVGDRLAFLEHNDKIILLRSLSDDGIVLKPVKGSIDMYFVYNRLLWEKLGMKTEIDPLKFKLGESAKFELSDNQTKKEDNPQFLFGYYLEKI